MNESEPNMPKKCPQCGAPLPTGALEGLCPACLLKEGTKETATQPEMPAFDPPPIEEIAKLFPQLEIIALIGKGGMGAVYKARQIALDRLVALKILPPQIATGPGFAERFTREARALARLSHPNIVGIYEFGQVNNLPFFIMEFVDGANLRDLERAGKLSPREALQIVPQICEALQFAHDEGIVHRDIKPENILLDKRGRVKIADFGIAKIMGRAAAEAALTETRGVIGTPQYMAPEQVETPQAVDHRADIFSLGVVFYEMLTGELPLGKFSPPSRKVHVDVRLDEVVLRTLEKEPERRYQQASQVKTAVETIGSGVGTPLPSSPPVQDANALASQVMERNFALDIGSCVRRGWALVKSDFWPIIGVNTLIWVLFFAASSVGAGASGGFWASTSVIGILLSGPLVGGLNFYFLKKLRGERPTIETAFSGFSSNRIIHLFLGSFVVDTLTWLGFFCFVLPGIYLMVAWMFTLTLIIDKRLDFWPAMMTSMKVVNKRWWRFFAAFLVFALVGISGVLACGLGLFITVPIGIAALMYAFEDVFGAVQPVPAPAVGEGPGGTVVTPQGGGGPGGPGWKLKRPVIIGGAALVLVVGILALVSAHAPRGHLRMPRPPRIPGITRHHSSSTAAAPTDTATSNEPVLQEGFGPVEELVVTDAVNFASGKLIAMPEENTNADFSERIAQNIRRAELLGVDAYSQGEPPKLYTLGMAVGGLSQDDWENGTPDQVREAVASGVTNSSIVSFNTDDVPGTPAAFKTREGAFGIVQVMGVSEEPRGIKLRYKLLRENGSGPTSGDFRARLTAAKSISVMHTKDTALAGVAKDAAKAGEIPIVREALGEINIMPLHDQAALDSVRFLAKRGMRNQAIEIAQKIHNVAMQDQALADLAK